MNFNTYQNTTMQLNYNYCFYLKILLHYELTGSIQKKVYFTSHNKNGLHLGLLWILIKFQNIKTEENGESIFQWGYRTSELVLVISMKLHKEFLILKWTAEAGIWPST